MSITGQYTKSITKQYTKSITGQYTKSITGQYTNPKTTPTATNVAQTVTASINNKLAQEAAANAAARYAINSARVGGAGYNIRTGKPVTVPKTYAPNYYTDYNDPYAINSAADVLLNREAKARALAGIGMDKDFFKKLPGVSDALSIVPASLDLLWQQSIKPVIGLTKYGYDTTPGTTFDKLKGAVSGLGKGTVASGFNALNNIMETADIPANVVKGGLITGTDYLKEANNADSITDVVKDKLNRALTGQWDMTDAAQLAEYNRRAAAGAIKGLGITSAGRVNFDYNTGNVAKDMALEFVSDPLTWASFGAAGAVKGGIKGVTKSVLKESAEAVGERVSKKLVKTITREYLQSASKATLEDITKRVLDSKPVRNMAKQALKEAAEASTESISKKITKEAIESYAKSNYDNIAKAVVDKISKDAGINIAKKVYSASEGVQSALFKAALGTTPLGTTAYTIKGAKYLNNVLSNKLLKPIDKSTVDVFSKLDAIIKNEFNNTPEMIPPEPIKATTENTNTDVFKKYSDTLAANTIVLNRAIDGVQDIDSLHTNKFEICLDNYLDHIETIYNDAEFKKAVGADDLTQIVHKFDNVISELSDCLGLDEGANVQDVRNTLHDLYKKYIDNITTLKTSFDIPSIQYLVDAPLPTYAKAIGNLNAATRKLVGNVRGINKQFNYIKGVCVNLEDYSDTVGKAVKRVINKKHDMILNEVKTVPYINNTIDKRTVEELISQGEAQSSANLKKVMDLATKDTGDGEYYFGVDTDIPKELLDKVVVELPIFYSNKSIGADSKLLEGMGGFHGDNVQLANFNEIYYNAITSINNYYNNTPNCANELFDDLKKYHSYCDYILDQKDTSIIITNDALELYNAIESIGLDNFKTTVRPASRLISDEDVVYVTKTSQSLNNLKLMTIPSVNNFIDSMFKPNSQTSKILDVLSNQSEEGNMLVDELRSRAAAYIKYRGLVNTLLKIKDVPSGAVLGVLDSIATKSGMNLKVFSKYQDFFINEIIDKAELNFNQRTLYDSNALEEVYKRLGGAVGGTAHTACYDSKMTYYIAEHYNLIPADVIPIFYDLETTGLKSATGNIVQIGMHSPMLNVSTDINIHTDLIPPESLLNKLNTDTETFSKTFRDKTLPNEKTAISNFFTTIIDAYKDAAKQNKKLVLFGYNNNNFDDGHLIARARLNGVSEELIEQFKVVRKIDVINYVRANSDRYTFPAELRTQLKGYLEDYADVMSAGSFEKFAQPVDTALAKAMMQLNDVVNTGVSARSNRITNKASLINREYAQVANDIFSALKDMSTTNKELSTSIIFKDALAENETIMNALTKDIEGVAHYAAKKIIDMPQINMFYELPEHMREVNQHNIYNKSGRALSRLTQASYSMQRKFDRLKNAEPLESNSSYITDTLHTIKKYIADRFIVDDISYLKEHNDNPYYNYIELDYALRKLKSNPKKYKADWVTIVGESNAERISDIFKTPLSDEARYVDIFKRKSDGTYIDLTKELNSEEVFDRYFNMPDNLSDFKFSTQRIADDFKNFAQRDLVYDKTLENTNLIATASYKFKAIKDKLAEVWEKCSDSINACDDVEAAAIRKQLNVQTESLTAQNLARVTKLSPTEFASHLYNNCAGRITYTVKQIPSTDYINALADQHIITATTLDSEGAVRVFFIADKNYTDFFKQLPKPTPTPYKSYNITNKAYVNTVSELRNALNDLHGGVGDSLGDVLSPQIINKIDEALPEGLAEYTIPNEHLISDGYYNTHRFNQSNIGDVASRRTINMFTASNPLKALTTSYQNLLTTYDNKVQYAGMFFNKDMALGTSPLFKDLSDTDINTFLKEHKEYTCAILAEDKHCAMNYKIAKINPTGASAITKARNAQAIIIPTNQYLKLFNVINDFSKSSNVLKAINGFVTNTYKLGYLSTLGMVARNLMDGFVKGTIQMNSPLELPKVVSHWFDSCRLLNEYNDAYKQLLTHLNNANRFKLDKDFISEFFKTEYKGKLTEDVFSLIHEFISEGPSGGMTAEMDKYFKNLSVRLGKESTAIPNLDKAIYAYQKTIRTVFFPSIFVSNINGAVEQTLRLDQYLTMVENGYTKNKAMQKVIATQFNYDAKTLGQRYLETFLPFTGFTLANYEFYSEQMAKKGWVGTVLRDIMTPVYDLDSLSDPAMYDYDGRVHDSVFDDLAQARKKPDQFDWAALLAPNKGTLYISQGLLYQILNGNIRWNTHITDMTDERKELYKVLKLNPSFMDAFQFLNNPVNSLYGRLIPLLRDADSIINNNPKEYPYKTTPAVILNSLPLAGTLYQRYNAVKKGLTNTGDPAYILASVFGTSSQFKKSDPTKYATASKALKNLWYAQYKSNDYKSEYNPYPYTYKQYTKKSAKKYKNPIEKWLAYQYYLFVKNKLPEKYNPYVLYNGLRNPEDQFVKEPFNPNKLNPYASAKQVAYWYSLYKKNGLSEQYNPYLYYPQYSKRKGYSGKPFDPNNIDPNATAKQVAYWYAMYKTKGLADEYNPYSYYPQYSKYKPFDPDNLDPNATEKQVAYWYAMYKTKNLDDKFNPYTYYPQFAKQTKLFDPAHDFDPDATEKQVKAWYAKFKESGLPELFNPYNYYPQFSLANNTKLFDPAHDYNPEATSAQVAAWYAKFKESGLPDLFNPYKYYPQYSKSSGVKQMAVLNPMKLPQKPTEADISKWYNAFKALNLSEKYNPYNYYPEFKAKPTKLDVMHLPHNPTTKDIASWYAWYKANGKDQKYNPYNYYPALSSKSGSKKSSTVSFSKKGATPSIKANPTYKNYTRMYSAASYANKSTKNYMKSYHYTTNFYNKLYTKKGTSRIRLRLDTFGNRDALFFNISNIRYMFGRKWKYFDGVL